MKRQRTRFRWKRPTGRTLLFTYSHIERQNEAITLTTRPGPPLLVLFTTCLRLRRQPPLDWAAKREPNTALMTWFVSQIKTHKLHKYSPRQTLAWRRGMRTECNTAAHRRLSCCSSPYLGCIWRTRVEFSEKITTEGWSAVAFYSAGIDAGYCTIQSVTGQPTNFDGKVATIRLISDAVGQTFTGHLTGKLRLARFQAKNKSTERRHRKNDTVAPPDPVAGIRIVCKKNSWIVGLIIDREEKRERAEAAIFPSTARTPHPGTKYFSLQSGDHLLATRCRLSIVSRTGGSWNIVPISCFFFRAGVAIKSIQLDSAHSQFPPKKRKVGGVRHLGLTETR